MTLSFSLSTSISSNFNPDPTFERTRYFVSVSVELTSSIQPNNQRVKPLPRKPPFLPFIAPDNDDDDDGDDDDGDDGDDSVTMRWMYLIRLNPYP